MEKITFYSEATRTAISCMECLRRQKVAWVDKAKRLTKPNERILIYFDRLQDSEIYVELTNKKTHVGRPLYMFVKKLYTTTTHTFYSAKFEIEERMLCWGGLIVENEVIEFRNDGEEIANKCLAILRNHFVYEIKDLHKLTKVGKKKKIFVEKPENYEPRIIYIQLVNIIKGEKVYRFIYRKCGLETVDFYSASFIFT